MGGPELAVNISLSFEGLLSNFGHCRFNCRRIILSDLVMPLHAKIPLKLSNCPGLLGEALYGPDAGVDQNLQRDLGVIASP